MKKTFTFTVAEHPEFGTVGFRPAWYPNGDPLGGMAVAHDILEHFPNDDGEIEGELLALGAALYIRGDGGYWSHNMNPPEVHVASDFPMIWRTTMDRDARTHVKECPGVREVMIEAEEVVRRAVKNLREEGFEESELPDSTTRHRMMAWLTKGYRKAQRRYKKHGACSMAWTFAQIEQQANAALRRVEGSGLEEGQEQFVVEIDFATLTFRTRLIEPGEEEE